MIGHEQDGTAESLNVFKGQWPEEASFIDTFFSLLVRIAAAGEEVYAKQFWNKAKP